MLSGPRNSNSSTGGTTLWCSLLVRLCGSHYVYVSFISVVPRCLTTSWCFFLAFSMYWLMIPRHMKDQVTCLPLRTLGFLLSMRRVSLSFVLWNIVSALWLPTSFVKRNQEHWIVRFKVKSVAIFSFLCIVFLFLKYWFHSIMQTNLSVCWRKYALMRKEIC